MAVTGLVELSRLAVGLLAVTGLAGLPRLTGMLLVAARRRAVTGLLPTWWEARRRRREPAGLLSGARLLAELTWLLAKLTRLLTVGTRLLRRDGHHVLLELSAGGSDTARTTLVGLVLNAR
ncbi:hypothetical protein [Saccharothrix ecbatanensis]|uniref:hypothetical protein n=1 Tax=Saccharothrix ecbatanensis TaxID=1105145 RepID=UPI00161AB89B|nr:hypothetical protein [Saccharothrix ecbatanensis]